MTTKGRETMPYYTARGNRTLTIASLYDEDGRATTDDEAYAIAENLAHAWGESLTILKEGKPLGVVLPDRGF